MLKGGWELVNSVLQELDGCYRPVEHVHLFLYKLCMMMLDIAACTLS